jgi:hypothetical protein
MPRFTLPIASLIQGVSQQADAVRLPGQCELMDNAWVSPTDGLTKRHPIDHVKMIDAGDVGDPLVHIINRSTDERYVVLFGSDAVRVFETDGTEVGVYGPLSVGAPFTPDFTYLDTGSDKANKKLKALTLVDYTILLNRTVDVAMSSALSDPDPSDFRAFLFVRGGQYSTTYKATIKVAGVDPTDFSVTTWDGVALGSGVKEVWDLTIVTGGGVSGTWSVNILGSTATAAANVSANAVAVALQASITALPNVSATLSGNTVRITADNVGVHFMPAVTPGGTGTYSLVEIVAGENDTELSSIETTDIAQALADQISADGRFDVTVSGSVIQVDLKDAVVQNDVYRLSISPAGTVGTTWMLAFGAPISDSASYTVQAGDKASDVVEGLRLNIVANVPTVTATRSDKTLTITDNTALQTYTLTVTPATNGSYLLDHVAVGGTTNRTYESVKTDDGRGGAFLIALHRSVDAIDKLPLTCLDGFKLKIDGGTKATVDDYYVQFSADNLGEFGKGKWIESLGFGVHVNMDATTMPHALTRQQDDGSGTVTGTPDAKYFQWAPIDWQARTVGDEEISSAPNPSIANGTPLNDIFFFRNRLGFLSGQKVVMSEVGVYFNLFRTTVQDVVDSDPIDIRVPHHTAINLSNAVAFNRTLLLLSDRVNFVLDGQPLLTPRTVSVSPILEYEHDRDADPITVAEGVYFPAVRGNFTGVRQMIADPQVVNQFQVDDVSIAVPQYVPGKVIQFAANDLEGILLTLADGDQSRLYLLKTFVNGGQRFQVAWGRWALGDNARVIGLGFINTTLYLVVNRTDGTHLESMEIVSGRVDDGALYLTRLDRRSQFDTGVYDSMADTTTWTLDYEPDQFVTQYVVTRSENGNDGGTVYTVINVTGPDVTVAGDHSAEKVWIGSEYEFRYRFSRIFVHAGDPNVGKQHVQANGRLQVQHGIVRVQDTADFQVALTPYLRSELTVEYSSANGRHVIAGNLPLMTEAIRFGVFSRDPQIDLVSKSPLPVKFQSADFECNYELPGGYAVYRG